MIVSMVACHVCASDDKYNETSATTTKVPHGREQHCLEAPMISDDIEAIVDHDGT